MDFIEPCFGIGHNLSLICQMTSEDIKHQLIIIITDTQSANFGGNRLCEATKWHFMTRTLYLQIFGEIAFVKLQNDTLWHGHTIYKFPGKVFRNFVLLNLVCVSIWNFNNSLPAWWPYDTSKLFSHASQSISTVKQVDCQKYVGDIQAPPPSSPLLSSTASTR